jgi:hypothetical protein
MSSLAKLKVLDLTTHLSGREQRVGRGPKASMLKTHNSALNRVFDKIVTRGFVNKTHVPTLTNGCRDSERRPGSAQEEYASMIHKLPHWINKTQRPKQFTCVTCFGRQKTTNVA